MTATLKTILAGFMLLNAGLATSWAGCEKACIDTSRHAKDISHAKVIVLGGGMRQVDHANTLLGDNGYPGLSKYYAAMGLGGETRIHRMLTSSELAFTFSNEWKRGNQVADLYTAYFLLNTGFNLLPPAGRFDLFPYAGIGGAVLNLAVHNKETDFNEYSPSAAAPLNLYQMTMLFNAGLGFDFRSPAVRHGRSGVVGLRVGYLFDPTRQGRWMQDEVRVTNGPEPGLSGPYVRMVIGSIGPGHWKKEMKGSEPQNCPNHRN
jgi:hypothetical protein